MLGSSMRGAGKLPVTTDGFSPIPFIQPQSSDGCNRCEADSEFSTSALALSSRPANLDRRIAIQELQRAKIIVIQRRRPFRYHPASALRHRVAHAATDEPGALRIAASPTSASLDTENLSHSLLKEEAIKLRRFSASTGLARAAPRIGVHIKMKSAVRALLRDARDFARLEQPDTSSR